MKRWLIDILADLPGFSGFSLYGVLCHPIKAVFVYPYLEVKWFIQRGRRGYSDCDSWNLGNYLQKWMPEAVRSLKDGHGIPGKLLKEDMTEEITDEKMAEYRRQWNDILETIATGFEAARIMDEEMPFPGTARYEGLEQNRVEGMARFAEWHQCLWD